MAGFFERYLAWLFGSKRLSVSYTPAMTTIIDHARCSTDKQDLATQKAALKILGVSPSTEPWTAPNSRVQRLSLASFLTRWVW